MSKKWIFLSLVACLSGCQSLMKAEVSNLPIQGLSGTVILPKIDSSLENTKHRFFPKRKEERGIYRSGNQTGYAFSLREWSPEGRYVLTKGVRRATDLGNEVDRTHAKYEFDIVCLDQKSTVRCDVKAVSGTKLEGGRTTADHFVPFREEGAIQSVLANSFSIEHELFTPYERTVIGNELVSRKHFQSYAESGDLRFFLKADNLGESQVELDVLKSKNAYRVPIKLKLLGKDRGNNTYDLAAVNDHTLEQLRELLK